MYLIIVYYKGFQNQNRWLIINWKHWMLKYIFFQISTRIDISLNKPETKFDDRKSAIEWPFCGSLALTGHDRINHAFSKLILTKKQLRSSLPPISILTPLQSSVECKYIFTIRWVYIFVYPFPDFSTLCCPFFCIFRWISVWNGTYGTLKKTDLFVVKYWCFWNGYNK